MAAGPVAFAITTPPECRPSHRGSDAASKGIDNAMEWLYYGAVSREAICFYVAPWFVLHLVSAFAGSCL
jgi:hypothetical protein